MSYLTDLLHKKVSATQFLAKSVHYLKDKMGLTVDDSTVDKAVHAADQMTDVIEGAVKLYLQTTLPHLPAELATSAATMVLNHLDAAIAGAGNVVKANN